jgi:ATP-dependent DNA ligase
MIVKGTVDSQIGSEPLEPKQFVLDGELVISIDGTLSFEHFSRREA